MRGGRPGRDRAATVPVVRWRRRQRTIVLGQTRKSRAASATGSPPSIAPSSRSRRSAEYCFMRYPRTQATLPQLALGWWRPRRLDRGHAILGGYFARSHARQRIFQRLFDRRITELPGVFDLRHPLFGEGPPDLFLVVIGERLGIESRDSGQVIERIDECLTTGTADEIGEDGKGCLWVRSAGGDAEHDVDPAQQVLRCGAARDVREAEGGEPLQPLRQFWRILVGGLLLPPRTHREHGSLPLEDQGGGVRVGAETERASLDDAIVEEPLVPGEGLNERGVGELGITDLSLVDQAWSQVVRELHVDVAALPTVRCAVQERGDTHAIEGVGGGFHLVISRRRLQSGFRKDGQRVPKIDRLR